MVLPEFYVFLFALAFELVRILLVVIAAVKLVPFSCMLLKELSALQILLSFR